MYHDSDIIIIGSGFAALSFLKAYKNTKQKITILESGDWKFSSKNQEKNKVKSIGYPLRQNFVLMLQALIERDTNKMISSGKQILSTTSGLSPNLLHYATSTVQDWCAMSPTMKV